MKLLVDKLPKTKEECIFCILSNEPYHRCMLDLRAYDLSYGCTFWANNCALTRDEKCTYLQEVTNETLD